MLAIAHACQSNPELEIATVISDQLSAKGLSSAAALGIPTKLIVRQHGDSKAQHELALAHSLTQASVDVVVLAGFMRVLSIQFVEQFANRIINIHPSLLPLYPGLHTHERVLRDKQAWHGASVHIVTPELDAGPLLYQGILAVHADDTPSSLQQRVHRIEHQIYPTVLSAWADGTLRLVGSQPYWSNQPLLTPIQKRFPDV